MSLDPASGSPSPANQTEAKPISDAEREAWKTAAYAMLESGATVDQVVEKTHLDKPTVLGLLGAIRKRKKRLKKGLGNADAGASSTPKAADVPETETEEEGNLAAVMGNGQAGRIDLEELTEEEIRLRMQAVWRQTAMNPKVELYYAFVKSRGYTGSLSDFLNECVENVMRSKGVRLTIEQVNEID